MLNKKIILIVFLLASSTLFPYFATHSLVGSSSSEPIIHVEPVVPGPPYRVPVCDEFDVNIDFTGVMDIWYYNFTLRYDTTMLDVLEVSDDRFFDPPKRTKKSWDENKGEVHIDVIALNESKSGKGTLITIKFKSTGKLGKCDLVLRDILLIRDPDKGLITDPEKEDAEIEIVITRSKPIFIDKEGYHPICHDTLFFGDAIKIGSSNVVLDLQGHTIRAQEGGGDAVSIASGKRNVTIKNGNIHGFQNGIKMDDRCHDININNIKIFDNSHIGIYARQSIKEGVTIADTDIFGNENNEEGIYVWESYNVTIRNSTISQCGDGIHVSGKPGYCIISGNTIENNRKVGVKIVTSNGSIIENNNITRNILKGIELSENSNGNKIHHNNFIENTQQASDDGDNEWNQDYPHCGNYWDDYDGEDNCCGFDKNITFCDGTGDTPYPIDGTADSQDKYPLIDPYRETYWVDDHPYRIGEYPYAIHSNSSITNIVIDLENKPAQISFTVNTTDTPGFCNVIINTALINGAFHVLIDNMTIPIILTWDKPTLEKPKTYTLIHLNYSNGVHNVQVVGEVPYDINGNGKIDIIDIAAVAQNFGK